MEKDIKEVSRKAQSWSFVSKFFCFIKTECKSRYYITLTTVFLQKMTQLWRQLYDLTYPVTSMFSGAGFNHMIRETFGEETQMEDLWLPYFTVTTDITSSNQRLHTHGITSCL